jgi:hypothetical protein
MKLDDYQPPQPAMAGTTYATTVAAMTNSSTAIFFI